MNPTPDPERASSAASSCTNPALIVVSVPSSVWPLILNPSVWVEQGFAGGPEVTFRVRTMLDERKAAILRAVVEEYIETAQPVGSGAVAPQVGASPATVRNELSALEQEGYLRQPHTSAG